MEIPGTHPVPSGLGPLAARTNDDRAAFGTLGPDGWARLRSEAGRMAAIAYAPYSKFRVGAAAFVDDGRIVAGCNVENVSYGLGLCAECGLVSALHASGGGRLVAVACVDGAGELLAPCGRCRQLLYEHGGPELLVKLGEGVTLGNGVHLLGELLPAAFDPPELPGAPGYGGRAG